MRLKVAVTFLIPYPIHHPHAFDVILLFTHRIEGHTLVSAALMRTSSFASMQMLNLSAFPQISNRRRYLER
jgi:hypothetical protein